MTSPSNNITNKNIKRNEFIDLVLAENNNNNNNKNQEEKRFLIQFFQVRFLYIVRVAQNRRH